MNIIEKLGLSILAIVLLVCAVVAGGLVIELVGKLL